jgi:hypothetical protein
MAVAASKGLSFRFGKPCHESEREPGTPHMIGVDPGSPKSGWRRRAGPARSKDPGSEE